MSTVDELLELYQTDPKLQKDVSDILEDNKITPQEFFGFVKKYDLELSVTQLPMIIEEAKKHGFIKDNKQKKVKK
ncbi:MAG: hypothetical protein IKF07_02630 [Eubacterium sp.]|nr:hypothetical protein [Eubacterium sp.]